MWLWQKKSKTASAEWGAAELPRGTKQLSNFLARATLRLHAWPPATAIPEVCQCWANIFIIKNVLTLTFIGRARFKLLSVGCCILVLVICAFVVIGLAGRYL